MAVLTKSPALSGRIKSVAYWVATVLLAAELALGGIWDVLRIPLVREAIVPLGYPTYLLVILGVWNLLGAAVLLVPRFPLVKEWAYAGSFFVFSGAIASHVATGHDMHKLWFLSVLIVLIVISWALRPPSRRLCRCAAAQTHPDTTGAVGHDQN